MAHFRALGHGQTPHPDKDLWVAFGFWDSRDVFEGFFQFVEVDPGTKEDEVRALVFDDWVADGIDAQTMEGYRDPDYEHGWLLLDGPYGPCGGPVRTGPAPPQDPTRGGRWPRSGNLKARLMPPR